jgi:O-antigen ligase
VSSLAGSLRPRAAGGVLAALQVRAGAVVTWSVALAVVAISVGAEGGLRLERTTWTEVAMILLGAGLVAAALLTRRLEGPLRGGLTLLGLGALAVYSAVSITWSLSPADSWTEFNRALAYLAVFAGGLALVRMLPGRWPAVLSGVALGCVLVCGIALATKVLPEVFSPDETFARLREPFGYWNAVGLMAALAVPPLLWVAARRTGHAALNALAWPALGLVLVCLMLSYSRGALVALAVGLVFWFAVVPLRLRAATALIAAGLAAAPVVAWAFARDALSVERVPLPARTDAGHDLGALILLMLALLLVTGLAVSFAATQRPPRPRTRRLAGKALLAAVAVVPVVAIGVIAASPGQVSQSWQDLTNPNVTTPANTPNRLTATSSVRARYWREALDVHAGSKWVGAGAGAFEVARTRYRSDRLTARHAHGYVVQTLADLGWLGLALAALTGIAWLVAALRTTELRPRDRGRPFGPERIGLLTMTAVVVVFAMHSLIDWSWFVPGVTAVALLCAAWVAGRVPVEAPLRWAPTRAAWAGAAAVMIAALAASWAALQPVRAANAESGVLDALERGDRDLAERRARAAADRNPLSLEPRWQLAFIQDARGDRQAAERTLASAAKDQPANAEAWRRLGRYRISVLDDPQRAIEALRVAYFLDPATPRSASDLVEATRSARQRG